MIRYQVKDWDNHFENNKSRERDECSWCALPNKQDGLGYGRLIRLPDGPAMYGAFVAVILVASKQSRPRDGHLTDTGRADGVPHDAESLSIKTGFPSQIIAQMLQAVSDPSIGWITAYGSNACQVPAECPPSALEGKGREGKEGKGNESPAEGQYTQNFLLFWKAYPKKEAKMDAFKAWKAAKHKPELDQMLAAIAAQSKTKKWTDDGGRYIPSPARWIRGAQWDNEIPSSDQPNPLFAGAL